MGKKSKSGLLKSSINKRELTEMLLGFLNAHKSERFTLKRLFSGMGLKTHPLRMLCVDILNDMLDDGIITRSSEGERHSHQAGHRNAQVGL